MVGLMVFVHFCEHFEAVTTCLFRDARERESMIFRSFVDNWVRAELDGNRLLCNFFVIVL